MEKQVSNNSNVDYYNKSKQSPNQSLVTSFVKTPVPNIVGNDNNNVNTTAQKHSSTCRQSFYQYGRKFGYLAPISPYDREYVQGCNTNVRWKRDEYSDDDPDKNAIIASKDFMTKVKENKDKSTNKPLKRTPLPSTVVWNGQAETLETYISLVEGHVDQQPFMSYILLRSIARWWFEYGDPCQVILIARQRKIHHSINIISEEQFEADIGWLYGAMKQSLISRGQHILRHYQNSKDGIAVWKQFLDTYCYDGDVAV